MRNLVDATNFIDAHIPSTRVLIEQKSLGKDLREPVTQSDGLRLTPFQQAKKYVAGMPLSQHPRWIVTCNFAEFLVYDMEQPNGEPEHILLENLGKEYYRLQFLVDSKSEHLTKEMQVSMKAGEIVGELYDEITMPTELRKAHQQNDRAVMEAYGFSVKTMTESQCVAELFKLYQELAK